MEIERVVFDSLVNSAQSIKKEEDKAWETFEKKKQEILAKGKPFKAEFTGVKIGQGVSVIYEFIKSNPEIELS